MDLYTRLRRHILSWTHETPLPTVNSESWPTFQYWNHFHHASQQWIPVTRDKETPLNDVGPSNLTLVTWNIDATSARAEDRVTDIITFITESHPEVHIIFLQEVSRPALQQILKDKRIRDHWVSSERDDAVWGKQSFATMSLLSKARFPSATLGPIWRVSYPNHFNRDALCCDVFVPSRRNPQSPVRVRLANVHLDSLPIKPSHRPLQISIVSSYLRSAGCGVVAGDFNPVLDEDATLLERNGLADIWTTLRPEDPGYTWGVDGEQPFPQLLHTATNLALCSKKI